MAREFEMSVLLTFCQFCAKVMPLGYNPNLGNQVLWCPPFKVSSWSGNTQETREGTFKSPLERAFLLRSDWFVLLHISQNDSQANLTRFGTISYSILVTKISTFDSQIKAFCLVVSSDFKVHLVIP